MSRVFLGIDIGTFETKGVLVDDVGTVVARARRRHGISRPAAGHVEHDPIDVWWRDITEIAHELMSSAAASAGVAAVGVSAIGPCVVVTDGELTPLRPAILYGVDNRATRQIAELSARLGEQAVLERSGNLLTSQSAGPKIKWIKDNEPATWERARWFMTSQSWIVARLTGRVVIDHATAGYFHPLYDLTAHRWEIGGCEDFISTAQLPELAWSSEIAGAVTPQAAAATGIPSGTPVIVGTTDSPAEAVGAGVVDDGSLMLQYGSTGYFIRVGREPIVSRELWSAPFVFEGTSVLAAGTATAGTATRWAAELLGLSGADDDVFAALIELAARSQPGARGVLMLPHLSGERTPFQDPDSRAAFIGLGLEHGRADLARAVLEGIGHSVAAALSAYAASGVGLGRAVAIGGATKNPFILEAVSTITGIKQEVATSEGAAFGDAILAALGVGVLASPAAAAAWQGDRRAVQPVPTQREVLLADHATYLELYRALAPLQHSRMRSHA